MKAHNKDTTFSCDQCDAKFYSQNGLKIIPTAFIVAEVFLVTNVANHLPAIEAPDEGSPGSKVRVLCSMQEMFH